MLATAAEAKSAPLSPVVAAKPAQPVPEVLLSVGNAGKANASEAPFTVVSKGPSRAPVAVKATVQMDNPYAALAELELERAEYDRLLKEVRQDLASFHEAVEKWQATQ